MSRSAIASHATLPLQNTIWRMASRSVTNGSSTISWNEPCVSSSIGDRVCFIRRPCFGVNRISGVCRSVCTWRRSRWKYWAAVVALQTWMLSSAAAVRKRSMRAELCSGPWPS